MIGVPYFETSSLCQVPHVVMFVQILQLVGCFARSNTPAKIQGGESLPRLPTKCCPVVCLDMAISNSTRGVVWNFLRNTIELNYEREESALNRHGRCYVKNPPPLLLTCFVCIAVAGIFPGAGLARTMRDSLDFLTKPKTFF